MFTLVLIALLLLAVLVPTHGAARRLTLPRRPAARSLRDALLYAGLALLIPTAAFAAESVVAPPQSTFESLVASVMGVAVAILAAVARQIWADRFNHRMLLVSRAIDLAYGVTNNAAKFTKTTVDDKVAFALGELRKQLELQGIAVTPAIEAQARATWDSMHAQERIGLAAAGLVPLPVKARVAELASPQMPPAAP